MLRSGLVDYELTIIVTVVNKRLLLLLLLFYIVYYIKIPNSKSICLTSCQPALYMVGLYF